MLYIKLEVMLSMNINQKLSYKISGITNIVQISNFTIEVAFDISLYDYMAISNHNAIKLL
jgi:hypothetical protein